jgi:hypothetical protein
MPYPFALMCLSALCYLSLPAAAQQRQNLTGFVQHTGFLQAPQDTYDSTVYHYPARIQGTAVVPSLSPEPEGPLPWDTAITWRLDKSLHRFVPLRATVQHFRPDGQLSDRTVYQCKGKTWQPVRRDSCSYGETGRPVRSLEQELDAATGAPAGSRQIIYQYTGGLLTGRLEQHRDDPSAPWINDRLQASGYNAAGQLISATVSVWPHGAAAWQPVSRYSYQYLPDGNLEYTRYWKWQASGWSMQAQRYPLNFTPSGKVYTELVYYYDSSARDSIYDYRYDGRGFLSSLTSRYMSGGASSVNCRRYQWTYASDGQPATCTTDTWKDPATGGDGDWHHAHTDYILTYCYSRPADTGHPAPVAAATVRIFPCPAVTQLTIEAAQPEAAAADLTLLNDRGQVLRQWQAAPAAIIRQVVPVGDLGAGRYYLHIRSRYINAVRPVTVLR